MVSTQVRKRKVYGGHTRVLIDTNIWLYHLEGNGQFAKAAATLIGDLERGSFEGVVSELTLMELQVRPLQLDRPDIADEYELLLGHFPHLSFLPVTRSVLTFSAVLRARYRLKTPDAIILSTGIRSGATLAISNDQLWQRVREIEVRPLETSAAA
jgi:predicted nucleic acid-binding protein